jgi:hypothetical protein
MVRIATIRISIKLSQERVAKATPIVVPVLSLLKILDQLMNLYSYLPKTILYHQKTYDQHLI